MTEPYYEADGVTLYHGDCLTITEWLDADVLVTDPPYGIGGDLSFSSHGSYVPHREFGVQEWDRSLDVRDQALRLWHRGGDRPAAVFASPRRIDNLPAHRQVPLVWDKGDTGMGDTTFPWRPSYELICVTGPGWSGHRGESVLRSRHLTSRAREVGHPTPKPLSLMEQLIAKAPPGVIADPFAGSGSTLLAARAQGRRAIGVELEERYCEVAARRLAQGVLL